MLVLELHVVASGVGEERAFLVGQRPRLAGRAAHVQEAAEQALARRHQATSADDHIVLHHRPIHDRAAHADQDAIAQGAAMQHDLVADGHVVTDQQRKTVRIERAGMGDVQHTGILHAGALADADAVHVCAHHGQRPDRTIGADLDVADDHRRAVDEGAFAKARRMLLECANSHDRHPLCCR